MKMTEYFKGHPVVLASGSPRRKELLEQIGIKARIKIGRASCRERV